MLRSEHVIFFPFYFTVGPLGEGGVRKRQIINMSETADAFFFKKKKNISRKRS